MYRRVIPYRRRLVRLPLQRSLFTRLEGAAVLLGLADSLPGGRFGAWLDKCGDLFLDRSHVEQLAKSLRGRLTPEQIEASEQAHRDCCASLVAATDRAERLASSADAAELRGLAGELGDRVAAIIPYAILSKFVPDALCQALAAAGEALPPPFPRPSLGAELVESSLELHRACLALGFPPRRLDAEWPAVPPEVASIVRRFCRDHVGFGPLQWEAPGYEDPRYVFGMLRAALGDSARDGEERRTRVDENGTRAADGTEESSATRAYLAFWLDFLERETWYVRRAFHRGMIPILRRLAAVQRSAREAVGAEDLLFLEIGELRSDAAAPDLAARRREYLADSDYLKRHGIDAARLGALFQED